MASEGAGTAPGATDEQDPSQEAPAAEPLATWLAGALPGRGPFTLRRLSGGNSNHTYLLRDGAGDLILRRPPHATVDASAHNVGREHVLLRALDPTPAPVPHPVAFCDDLAVWGAPFLIMERVDGVSITDRLPPEAPEPGQAAWDVGTAVTDALAAVHAVDWQAVGLQDFGRPDGFLERQVPRWRKQFARVQVREIPHFDAVGDWLDEHRPASFQPGIMHGDFHVDNCLVTFAPRAHVSAIIDWEMATIGDPLVDLGLMLGLWGADRPERPALPAIQGFSRAPGGPTREQLAERYAERSTRSLDDLTWYIVLALWKIAAVIEGAYANYVAGRDDRPYTRALEHDVPALVAEAAGLAERG